MVKTGQIAAHLIPPRCVTIRFEGTRRIASYQLSTTQNIQNIYVRSYLPPQSVNATQALNLSAGHCQSKTT